MNFEDIYKTYWQKIYRLCLGYMNNHDAAKDMAQDTFVKVWQQLPNFREESSIGTWIFRIASNNCFRQIEKDSRFSKTKIPVIIEEESEQFINADVKFLYHCIAELPEMDRIIISLELEEVNQSDIATIVGISSGNVRVKIHRIKEKLTKKFQKYER